MAGWRSRGARRGKSRLRRAADYFSAAVFLAIVAVVAAFLFERQAGEYSAPFRVMDGDSLESGNVRLRLEGIDAPEYRQACGSQSGNGEWQCGRQARQALARLVARDTVCRGGATDRYGRVLVRCRRGDLDVNEEMVRLGFAVSSDFGSYASAEREAREAGRGMWAGKFQHPGEWREEHGTTLVEVPGGAGNMLRGLLDRVSAFLSGWFGQTGGS